MPHMDSIRELLDDPGALNEVVIAVVSWLRRAPISALEPHVGTFVRLLERDGGANMAVHKAVGAFLERIPTHWLAPHLSLLLRAWHTALVKGWGKVEKLVDLEDDEEWSFNYSTEGDYCVKTEEDQDDGW